MPDGMSSPVLADAGGGMEQWQANLAAAEKPKAPEQPVAAAPEKPQGTMGPGVADTLDAQRTAVNGDSGKFLQNLSTLPEGVNQWQAMRVAQETTPQAAVRPEPALTTTETPQAASSAASESQPVEVLHQEPTPPIETQVANLSTEKSDVEQYWEDPLVVKMIDDQIAEAKKIAQVENFMTPDGKVFDIEGFYAANPQIETAIKSKHADALVAADPVKAEAYAQYNPDIQQALERSREAKKVYADAEGKPSADQDPTYQQMLQDIKGDEILMSNGMRKAVERGQTKADGTPFTEEDRMKEVQTVKLRAFDRFARRYPEKTLAYAAAMPGSEFAQVASLTHESIQEPIPVPQASQEVPAVPAEAAPVQESVKAAESPVAPEVIVEATQQDVDADPVMQNFLGRLEGIRLGGATGDALKKAESDAVKAFIDQNREVANKFRGFNEAVNTELKLIEEKEADEAVMASLTPEQRVVVDKLMKEGIEKALQTALGTADTARLTEVANNNPALKAELQKQGVTEAEIKSGKISLIKFILAAIALAMGGVAMATAGVAKGATQVASAA